MWKSNRYFPLKLAAQVSRSGTPLRRAAQRSAWQSKVVGPWSPERTLAEIRWHWMQWSCSFVTHQGLTNMFWWLWDLFLVTTLGKQLAEELVNQHDCKKKMREPRINITKRCSKNKPYHRNRCHPKKKYGHFESKGEKQISRQGDPACMAPKVRSTKATEPAFRGVPFRSQALGVQSYESKKHLRFRSCWIIIDVV